MADKKGEHLSSYDQAVLNRLFNPNLPYSELPEEEAEEEAVTEAEKAARDWEVKGVQAAEAGDMKTSIEHFMKAVEMAPNRASAYNNLAQTLRLKGETEAAEEHLNKAITLSGGRGKAACQAYTQRGLLKKLHQDEESALTDFKKAANLGGQFAQQQVVAMNPYAALCNQMLGEVMLKLRTGQDVE